MDKGVLVTDKAINEIISQCHDVRADWWHLGISLGVLYSTLEAIEARHKGDVDRCLSVLISTWLRRAKGEVKENVRPTWKSLCESLSYINGPLAETIAREHRCGYINPIVSKVAAGAPGADPPTFLPQSCGCGQCTVKGRAALGSGVCQNVYHDRKPLLLVVDRCSPQVRFEESYDRKAKLCAETSKITDLFASVCLKTWMCLRNIDNHKVAKLGFKLSAWLGRSFPMISNIFKLQAFMHSLGISWFNYESLHFLAKETLDSGLISSWDNYIDCFTYYCSERNLKEYTNVFFQTEQQHVFLLEVDECYSQFTLSDIKDLRKSLSTALKIPFVSLHLVTVRTGSLFIYFHYGYTDYLMMFKSLSSQQLREIASIKGYRILSLVDFYDQFKHKNIQKYYHLKEAVPKSEEQLSTSVTDNSSGGRGGFGGRSRDNEDGESRGGFGRGRENGDDNGGRRGFGRRDQDGEGGSRGFGKRQDNDGESGGGFSRRRDNDRESGGGFGGRRNRDDNQEGGFGRGGGDREGGDDRPREVYVPPLPTDDEDTLYQTISAGINFDRYDEIPVKVTGRDAPAHINSFEECGFFDTTKENIRKCKYERPTPVQKYAIPIGMGGRDLMACAQTGSGKTAAFLLPSITRLIKENVPGATRDDSQSPQVLIISPTRELTSQIYDEARKFTRGSIYRPVVCYGGTSVGHQLRQIEGGCNILVCTPGRLMDFLRRKKVLLDHLKTFILDEADRMLDMGFGGDIRSIVEEFDMPPKTERQTLMFSATFPEEIQQLAAKYLNDYVFLTVGRVGGATTDITQSVVDVGEYEKREKLVEILKTQASDRTLVFVETKRNADFLASFLSQEGFPTTSIHGDRFQREREEALRDFRSGRAPVLVATSVAARGLDIPEVKHVVNYDLPKSIEEYVHRIGRTGRIGNKGLATAFFQKDKDAALARSLVKILGDAEQDVPDFLEQAAEEATGTNYGPQGGQFASKDIRSRGGGGGGGFSKGGGGWGESSGGFDNDGGFSNNAAAQEDEEWD